ncbi:MAG: PorT family protein [Treponema sp.]|nr:PorT family protein [Treponema sp.]
MNTNTNKRSSNKSQGFYFGLLLLVLFPRALAAQNVLNNEAGQDGFDYDGKAITAVLPITGEEEAAAVFNAAVFRAVTLLQKYSPRAVNAETVRASGIRIPTDMPPIRELAPGTRYALTGGVYPGNYEGEFYLQLWLWDMRNSTFIYTDDLRYQNIDEALQILPGLVEFLFSHITEVVIEPEPVPEDPWENKRINIGFRSGVSQRWYTSAKENAPGAHALVYEGGIFGSAFLNPLISVQIEANFSFDNLVYRDIFNPLKPDGYISEYINEKYTTYALALPLIVKANFKSRIFRFAPFAGIYASIPLGDAAFERNPLEETDSYSWSASMPFGYTLGLETAVRCGPGMLLADIRYSGDFASIVIKDDAETSYKRRALSLTLGYAFGFINIKK